MKYYPHHSRAPWTLRTDANGTHIRNADGGLVASMEAGSQAARDRDALTVQAAPELLACLARAAPWLGFLIAHGAHRDSVLPRDAEACMEQTEALLQRLGVMRP